MLLTCLLQPCCDHLLVLRGFFDQFFQTLHRQLCSVNKESLISPFPISILFIFCLVAIARLPKLKGHGEVGLLALSRTVMGKFLASRASVRH